MPQSESRINVANFWTTVICIEAFFYALFPKLHNTGFITADIRNSHRRSSMKKLFLKISQYAQEKRDSNTGVFL